MSIIGGAVRRHAVTIQKEASVEYMLLIYAPTDAPEGTDEEREAMFAEYGKFTQKVQDAGALIASDPLQPTHTATTVRGSDGEALTTDGPFAETKEWLGGYYKIEAESLDQAIAWASQIPAVKHGGSVEVRPVMPIPAESPSSS
jgi:hypothetical protein